MFVLMNICPEVRRCDGGYYGKSNSVSGKHDYKSSRSAVGAIDLYQPFLSMTCNGEGFSAIEGVAVTECTYSRVYHLGPEGLEVVFLMQARRAEIRRLQQGKNNSSFPYISRRKESPIRH